MLTVSHQIGLRQILVEKHDHLRDDAPTIAAAAGSLDGSLGCGSSLGGVISNGCEERSEGIHWCVCVCVEICYESV